MTNVVSKEIYDKHEEIIKRRFGNKHVPTYSEIFDWINDASGIAIFINIVGHTEWDNSKIRNPKEFGQAYCRSAIPSKTSLPCYKAFAFHYSELLSCPDEFVDDWGGCADNAIDMVLTRIYNTDLWYDEFTEPYDGSCDNYNSIDEYIEDCKNHNNDLYEN